MFYADFGINGIETKFYFSLVLIFRSGPRDVHSVNRRENQRKRRNHVLQESVQDAGQEESRIHHV